MKVWQFWTGLVLLWSGLILLAALGASAQANSANVTLVNNASANATIIHGYNLSRCEPALCAVD